MTLLVIIDANLAYILEWIIFGCLIAYLVIMVIIAATYWFEQKIQDDENIRSADR